MCHIIPAMLWYDLFTNVLCLGRLVFSVIIFKGGEIFMEWGVVEDHLILRGIAIVRSSNGTLSYLLPD